ncbi:MAG: hypothetical protein L3J88_00025 [Gammaproteobacteria bacterium]|nr:hypothetical protein [Gammaproteobacteria bacterium]MCF6361761.1 hypothetical protein [Gammaproteobacteria bacterium]
MFAETFLLYGGCRMLSVALKIMYQLEVKYHLIRQQFPPSEGWEVTVDIDASFAPHSLVVRQKNANSEIDIKTNF